LKDFKVMAPLVYLYGQQEKRKKEGEKGGKKRKKRDFNKVLVSKMLLIKIQRGLRGQSLLKHCENLFVYLFTKITNELLG
jgi:hypothetical protein